MQQATASMCSKRAPGVSCKAFQEPIVSVQFAAE
jgi:hypothetical protein